MSGEEVSEEADLLYLFLVKILWNPRAGNPSLASITENLPYHLLKAKKKKVNKEKKVLKICVTFFSVVAACVQESEVAWKYLKVANWLK